jgi:hypothetical protein
MKGMKEMNIVSNLHAEDATAGSVRLQLFDDHGRRQVKRNAQI